MSEEEGEYERTGRPNPFRQVAKEVGDHLMMEMQSRFTPLPSVACQCGKPVVFPYPAITFDCTRCGAKYKLTVLIEQVAKGNSE